jgi:hypothetical protein
MMESLTCDAATITTIIVLYAISKGHILVSMAVGCETTTGRHGVSHDKS